MSELKLSIDDGSSELRAWSKNSLNCSSVGPEDSRGLLTFNSPRQFIAAHTCLSLLPSNRRSHLDKVRSAWGAWMGVLLSVAHS